jgi:hypothetical protein
MMDDAKFVDGTGCKSMTIMCCLVGPGIMMFRQPNYRFAQFVIR